MRRIDICFRAKSETQFRAAVALRDGLARHGIEGRLVPPGMRGETPIVACWGWKLGRRYRARGHDVLVMELAYLRDRYHWVSLGWNGLNGRAQFPAPDDGGARWRHHFSDVMRPWRKTRDGYTLLVGQVPGDAAVKGIDIAQWASDVAWMMKRAELDARWRPHPLAPGIACHVPTLAGDLAAALAGAACVVTYNSNTGVDAVMAGVPAVTWDEGAMAWPVTAHKLPASGIQPDRTAWAHRLAWCQWLPEEIARGEAWEHLLASFNILKRT